MPSITTDYITCNFSISSKNANGDFTISANFSNSSGHTIANVRLSCSLTDGAPWSRIDVGTISPHGSASGNITISSGNTGSQTVYCYLVLGSQPGGNGGAYSVPGYTPPVPDFEKKILSISPSTVVMGNGLNISETSGVGVSSIDRRWSCGNRTGAFSIGQWLVPIEDFEPLTPNANQVRATFTTTSSGNGGSGSSSVNVTLKVPSNYLPNATHEYQFIDAKNDALVAGYSKLKLIISPGVVPEDNHATIASCTLLKVTTTNTAITVNSFIKSGNTYTSVVLPSKSGVPSYTFSLTFRIKDSRGNVLDYTTNTFRVTNFIPPYVNITDLKRETSTTGRIRISITSPSAAYAATLKIGDGQPINVKNSLVAVSGGYTLDYPITGLQPGNQYLITFTYQDTNMHNYGESAYSYTKLLSTMQMPLSLYDDGSKIYISFGEESSDNYGESFVVNFAKNIYLRYIDDNDNVVCEKVQDLLTPCPYAVGDILQTIDDTDPSDRWQGTEWQQLTDRFLIGAGGNYNVEDEGGEEEHTLTVDEIPEHSHSYYKAGISDVPDGAGFNVRNENDVSATTGTAGGGQPHNNMPPYYAVYMWLRIA